MFKCGICLREFTRIDHLARHTRIHTKEKPYSCKNCDKAFPRADLLKRHACANTSDDGSKNTASSPVNRVSQACSTCAASKVRCDEEKPCRRCKSKNIECKYPTSIRNNSVSSPTPQTTVEANTNVWDINNAEGNQVTQAPPAMPNLPQHIAQEISHRQYSNASLSSTAFSTADSSNGNQITRTNSTNLPPQPTNSHGLSYVMNEMDIDDISLNHDPSATLAHHRSSSRTVADGTLGFEYSILPSQNKSDHRIDFLRGLLSNSVDISLARPVPTFDGLIAEESSEPYNIWDSFMNTPFGMDPSQSQPLSREYALGIDAHTSNLSQANSPELTKVLGAVQAFNSSFWNWVPSPEDTNTVDESNLTLPRGLAYRAQIDLEQESNFLNQKISPDTRDKVLNLVVAVCDKQDIAQIILSFPSATLMERLLGLFLRADVSQPWAKLHLPTLDISSLSMEHLTAMIAYGAVMTQIPALQKLGHALPELIRKSILEQWDRDNSKTRDSSLLQAFALINAMFIWSGDKRKMEIGESFFQSIVTIARRCGILRRDQYAAIKPNESDSEAEVDRKWRLWVRQESRKRFVLNLFVQDTQISMMHNTAQIFSCNELVIPLPEPDALWFAPSAQEWKTRSLARPDESPVSLSDCISATLKRTSVPALTRSSSTQILTLHGLWQHIWRCRADENLMQSYSLLYECGNGLMISARKESLISTVHQFGQNFGVQTPELSLLYHLLLLVLHAPLPQIESFVGKNGESEAVRTYPSLLQWVSIREARLAIWHAAQVLSMASVLPPALMMDFHALVVYKASLTLFVYGVVTEAHSLLANRHMRPQNTSQDGTTQHWVMLSTSSLEDIEKFVAYGEGTPTIGSASVWCPIHDGVSVMKFATDILKRRTGSDSGKIQAVSLFVENLTQLMTEIARAANLSDFGAEVGQR